MGNVYVFSFRGTHDTSHNFVTLSSRVSLYFFAMQNPRKLSISGCVLKPETVEGSFQNR